MNAQVPEVENFYNFFYLSRAEQEGTELKAVDLQPFLDFVKRNNLQMEFFSIGPNQCESLAL